MYVNFFKNNPSFKILIPFVMGIILAVLGEQTNPSFFLIPGSLLLLAFASFFLFKYKRRLIKGILLSILIFTLGVSIVIIKTAINYDSHFSKHINKDSVLLVVLDEQLQEKEKTFKGNLRVLEVINNGKAVFVTGKLLAYLSKNEQMDSLKYGDAFLIKNKIAAVTSPSNPQQFNYKHYLTLNNINHQVFLTDKDIVRINSSYGSWLIRLGYCIRDYCYEKLIINGLKGDELKVASALLLGYREMLDKDLVQSYSSAGAMHVLAVSGLHVGILFFLLKVSLGFLKRLWGGRYVFVVAILLTLWFYALMTGFSPSVLRATTMFSFLLVGEQLINRKTSIYNTLGVSAIVLLVVNPYLIFEVGFQLSYLAVVGIVYLQPKIYNLFYVPNKLLDHAWKITAVSLAAQIATFPLGLYYFHQFPLYFFVSNLIVIPAAIFIIYVGVLLFVTTPFGGISLLFGKILSGIIYILNQVVFITEDIPASLIKEISITRFDTYLLYAVIVGFLVFFYYRRLKYFYLSGSLLVMFLVMQVFSEVRNTRNIDFTAYSVKNESVLEFAIGAKSYLVASEKLWADNNAMLFNIKHNWFAKNITNTTFISVDSLNYKDDNICVSKDFIWFQGLRILKLNRKNVGYIDQFKIDFIWIDKKQLNVLYKLANKLTNRDVKLLFDSSVSNYKVNYWRKHIKNGSIISTYELYFHQVLKGV